MKKSEDHHNKIPAQWEEAWKNWLNKPLESSANQAAAQIMSEIRTSRNSSRFKSFYLPVLASALVMLLIMVYSWESGKPPIRTQENYSKLHTQSVSAAPVGDDMVIIWLTPDTPLYMPLPETQSINGDQS